MGDLKHWVEEGVGGMSEHNVVEFGCDGCVSESVGGLGQGRE